jgi:large subunit ribosomal protein L21
MYAVVKVGGKQYRVESGDSLVVDRLHEDEGAKVDLQPLLLADGDDTVFEGDELEKVKVEATVTAHERGEKVRVLKFKPKSNYKRHQGHRSELTRLEIGEIKKLSRKPAKKKQTKEEDSDGS